MLYYAAIGEHYINSMPSLGEISMTVKHVTARRGPHKGNLHRICISMYRPFSVLWEISPTFIKTQNHTKAYHQAPLAKVHQSGNLTHFSKAVHQKGMLDFLLYWIQFS